MKFIPLTHGKMALVDDEDFDWLSKFKWHAQKHRHTWYARRTLTAKERSMLHKTYKKGGTRSMHTEIMMCRTDHKDGDGLNNTRSNLRAATQQQNCHNRRMTNANTSGFKGIWFHHKNKHFEAWIMHNGKRRYLGCSESPVRAAALYDTAALKHFGEFAKTNQAMGLFGNG